MRNFKLLIVAMVGLCRGVFASTAVDSERIICETKNEGNSDLLECKITVNPSQLKLIKEVLKDKGKIKKIDFKDMPAASQDDYQ